MGLETTLLIKHMPKELNTAQREEMLKIIGAVAVRVMPDDGKMRYSAFATFKNEEDTKMALKLLHQKEILGRRLVVEYAKEKHQNLTPHVSDLYKASQITKKNESVNTSEREYLRLDTENFSKSLHGIAPALGLDYIPSPLPKYKYPSPTPTIIQNICHALASVPKFYNQVLHLMNKMNLPAPFGPVTPAPPLAPDVFTTTESMAKVTPDLELKSAEDMEVTSEEESEYESDTDPNERNVVEMVLPVKRLPKKPKQKRKRQKITNLFPAPSTGPSKPPTEPSEVFESHQNPITQKKISVKKIDNIIPVDAAATAVEPTGGFGAFEAPKEVKNEESSKEPGAEIWDDSQFITMEELREKRISSREMKTMSIFRNFSPGDPSFRLYIKNLARQVEEKDLRYIFGKFIDRTSENDRTMFDIKLMKEGRMKGQAFVTLANETQAVKAVKETNGFILHTKPMVVQFARSAKPKEEKKELKKS